MIDAALAINMRSEIKRLTAERDRYRAIVEEIVANDTKAASQDYDECLFCNRPDYRDGESHYESCLIHRARKALAEFSRDK